MTELIFGGVALVALILFIVDWGSGGTITVETVEDERRRFK